MRLAAIPYLTLNTQSTGSDITSNLETVQTVQSMSLNDTPNKPSQTQAEDDSSFVGPLPQVTDFQCRPLLTSCAAAHYVHGLVETREPMSLGSFCHGMAVLFGGKEIHSM